MSKNNAKVKKALTVTMSVAFLITLSSCSGATNTYGKLDSNAIYAEAGDYKVTNGELWDELKWNVQDTLTEQKNNVVLNDQFNKIALVCDKKYSDLSDDEKTTLNVDSVEKFNELYTKYTTRLADYVVQDVFNLTYSTEDYWDSVEDLTKTNKTTSYQKYADEIFAKYQKTTLADGTTILDAVKNATKDDFSKLVVIAKELRELYFPLFAKELLAYDALTKSVDEAIADNDEDEEKYGTFSYSDIVNKFKTKYTNTYDIHMIPIKFSTTDEFNSTLRAFGVKIYNKKYYFLRDNTRKDYDTYINSEDKMSMDKYVDYYNDFSSSNLDKTSSGAYLLSSQQIFELYVQIYNYMYSGYRTKLTSIIDVSDLDKDLNKLRDITYRITTTYATQSQSEANYEQTIANLLASNNDAVTYTSDDLNDIASGFKAYVYDTLKLQDDNGYEDMDSRYSTATQNYNSGYYIVYKFDDELENIEDEKLKSYEEFYNSSLSTYDIFSFIQKEENADLLKQLLEYLKNDGLTESYISNTLTEKLKDLSIKIYNEAVEMGYKAKNSDYSTTIGGAKNSNILATLSYNNKTWNLNIKADADDKDSITFPGTTTVVGVYDLLEKTTGATTAIDLISRKAIKDTNAYKEALKDTKTRNNYKTAVENILLYFSNNYYSSSGYDSSIGKYNFLNLYFHTANIDKIVDDTYMVSYASSKLLTNYANEDLAKFFEEYTTLAYNMYFSLEGTRFVVYMDKDEDNNADELDKEDWTKEVVSFRGSDVTRAEVAETLISEVYAILAASSTSHTDKLTSLVTEINESARAVYEENPIVNENKWAEYRKLGFKVKTETLSVKNSTTDEDFALKQRLYDYARGTNEAGTKSYYYFINESTPTLYIEPTPYEDLVVSNDGVNLIVISSGSTKASAVWSAEDNDTNDLLKNIKIKYNDEIVTIENIFNEKEDTDGALNINQIMLYNLDYAVNGSSTLIPSSISSAITTFLQPVYSRFTSSETQRIILLTFIKNRTKSTSQLYDVVKFANESYNGENGVFAKVIEINQNIADNYAYLVEDTTGTSDTFKDWWKKLYEQIDSFLQKEEA